MTKGAFIIYVKYPWKIHGGVASELPADLLYPKGGLKPVIFFR